MGAAFFKVLAVYYIINMEYPATYQVLNVIDKFCLKFDNQDLDAKKGKKPKKKKQYQCLTNFLSLFKKHMSLAAKDIMY